MVYPCIIYLENNIIVASFGGYSRLVKIKIIIKINVSIWNFGSMAVVILVAHIMFGLSVV